MHVVFGDQTLLPGMSALENVKIQRSGGAQASAAPDLGSQDHVSPCFLTRFSTILFTVASTSSRLYRQKAFPVANWNLPVYNYSQLEFDFSAVRCQISYNREEINHPAGMIDIYERV